MLVKNSKSTLQVSVYDIKGKFILASKEIDPNGGITFTHAVEDNFYGVYTYGSHANDGNTYSYEKGQYFKQNISLIKDNEKVKIIFDRQEKNYKPDFTSYIAKVHQIHAQKVLAGKYDLKRYSSSEELLKANSEGFCIDNDIYGKVTIIKLKTSGLGQIILVKM